MPDAPAVADLRESYERDTLDAADLPADPFALFADWFAEAQAAATREPNAMTLATATPDGTPSARIVLLKGVDHGFCFYTNHESRKGRELDATHRAALVFWWPELERQVRVEGTVERVAALVPDREVPILLSRSILAPQPGAAGPSAPTPLQGSCAATVPWRFIEKSIT